MEKASEYLAFISYRHSEKDRRIAGLIRRGLENWHLPGNAPFGRKNRRCFRDVDELPTSADLGTDIERALEGSQWLVAVCSEDYVKSRWCRKEIESFIAMGRKDRILPVIIRGTKETSVPVEIRDIEPVAVIANREMSTDSMLAALFGRMSGEKDASGARYLRSEKRNRFIKFSAVAMAVVIAVLAFAFYGIYSADRISRNNELIEEAAVKALEAADLAREERNNALLMNAKMVSEEAWNEIDAGNEDKAIEMLLNVIPEDLHGDEPVSAEAVSALRAALSSPNRPKDEWKYTHSIETDFDIKGFFSSYNSRSYLILPDGSNSLEEHCLFYDNDEIMILKGISRVTAEEYGYSKGYLCNSGSPLIVVVYGPEKPIASDYRGSLSQWFRPISLNGEPVYADHIIEAGSSYYAVCWIENPEEGKESPPCIIELRKEEAIGKLDITGNPVSASFSNNRLRLAVVDEAGELSFHDVKSATKRAVIPGKWSFVYYPAASNKVVCIDSKGTAYLYDTMTLEPIYSFESPTPVKSIQYGGNKGIFLALCEDAVRVYNDTDGKLLNVVPFKEGAGAPNYMTFEMYEEYLWDFPGTSFVLLYDRRIDYFGIETETDLTRTDYLPLFKEGRFDVCSAAFYSRDGCYVYKQEYHGELSKWDARTGEMIWENNEQWSVQGNVHANCVLSRDGTFIWRVNSHMNGMERVDEKTGETVYSVNWAEQTNRTNHLLMPVEGEGSIAFTTGDYDNCLVAFDKNTGEFLWYEPDAGDIFCFSEDETEIYCFGEYVTEDEKQLIYKCFETKTGKLLKEKVLFSEPLDGSSMFRLRMDSAKRRASFYTNAAGCLYPDTPEGEYRFIIIDFSADTGEETGRWETGLELTDCIFSYTGRQAVIWEDRSADCKYCNELLPDGKLGETFILDSKEGRILSTMVGKTYHEDLMDIGDAWEFGLFAGDEVTADHIKVKESVKILRISDGAVILNLPFGGVHRGVAIAPDGSSLCIYGPYTTPVIIMASDTETLVAKARNRAGGGQ
ncbi:MAG: TIR domain-containing protein [Lachnospiraceae bacterium]|nr:TIR domain-containing protein [Lachnospiraceae bacterium]